MSNHFDTETNWRISRKMASITLAPLLLLPPDYCTVQLFNEVSPFYHVFRLYAVKSSVKLTGKANERLWQLSLQSNMFLTDCSQTLPLRWVCVAAAAACRLTLTTLGDAGACLCLLFTSHVCTMTTGGPDQPMRAGTVPCPIRGW